MLPYEIDMSYVTNVVKPGDIICFDANRTGKINHVAIVDRVTNDDIYYSGQKLEQITHYPKFTMKGIGVTYTLSISIIIIRQLFSD
jgi:hypothetical protein